MFYTYGSRVHYSSDYQEVYNSALQTAELYHNQFTIVSHKFEEYYCDGCGSYHVLCDITVQAPEKSESDLAIKLKLALKL